MAKSKTKKITGTYTWTATVEVKVPVGATNEEQREALDNEALDVHLDWKHPVLVDCSNEELID